MTQKLEKRHFLGFDTTPRRAYRAEVERLIASNYSLEKSLELSEKERREYLTECARLMDELEKLRASKTDPLSIDKGKFTKKEKYDKPAK